MTRSDYTNGLRMLANFFDDHPEVELPHDADVFNYFSADSRAEFTTLARALGSSEKSFNDAFKDSFELIHYFGAIKFRAIGNRATICRRIVKEVKHIEEKKIPACTIPAHDEELFEWDCSTPLLEEEEAKAP